MEVIAVAPGHTGKPITVARNGREIPADYIHVGDVFEWEGELASWMKPLNEEQPVEDRKAIMAKLDAAGIPYFKGAPTEKLQALLPKE